jgi:hypothetical protein
MVLCQVIISNPAVTYYPININGRNKVQILKIDYRYSAGGVDKLVVIKSDHLRLPFSNYPYFTFSANVNHQVSNISGDIVFDDVEIDGNFNLQIIDYETGVAPTNFQFLVLTMNITPY